MEDSCPATPLVLAGRESKSPLQVAISSPESDGMKSPSERVSPDSRCVICLGRLQNKSFTDSCLHQFCFQCLLQWSKVKPECPLCKQPFKSIIHNIRSNLDYDQYHVEHGEPRYVSMSDLVHSYDFDLIPVNRRFRYRSTLTPEYFRELAESFLGQTIRGSENSYLLPPLPTPAPNVRRSSRLHASSIQHRTRQRGTSEFRRNIYAQDLWVQDLPDVSGRYRECTPQFYRENPAQVYRIIPWLNREINVLLGDCASHASYVLDRIVSILPQHCIRSREFRQLVEPYFGNRTEHFIHELYTFAHSVYDMAGFDQNAVYGTNPNYATEVQEISSSNDDSDIEILETVKTEKKKKVRKPLKLEYKKMMGKRDEAEPVSEEPVAGPSGINSTGSIEICESDSNDIKILDYVKPEPEVVTLSSGEEKVVYSDLDVSNGEYVEVIPSDVDNGRTQSVQDEDYVLPSERKKTKAKSGKGKCKSNGFGLKGRQKRKYIKSRKHRSSSTSSRSSCSSSNSSRSTYDSRSSNHLSKSRRSRSSFSDSSSCEYKLSKVKKKKSKVSRKKNKKKNNRKSPKINGSKRRKSENGSEAECSKTKKRVKSCVIVPRSYDSSPPYKSKHSNALFRDSENGKDKRFRLLAPYWSITSQGVKADLSRKRRDSSVERRSVKSKRKYSKSSSDETQTKRVNASSSSSDGSSDSEGSKYSNAKLSRTCKKFKESQITSSEHGTSCEKDFSASANTRETTSSVSSSTSSPSSASSSTTSSTTSTVKLTSASSYANSD